MKKLRKILDKQEIRGINKTGIIEWAEDVLFDATLLELILEEELCVAFDEEGTPIFNCVDDDLKDSIKIDL